MRTHTVLSLETVFAATISLALLAGTAARAGSPASPFIRVGPQAIDANAAGVGQFAKADVGLDQSRNTVARHAGGRVNDADQQSGEPVKDRRLADVRAADDGDERDRHGLAPGDSNAGREYLADEVRGRGSSLIYGTLSSRRVLRQRPRYPTGKSPALVIGIERNKRDDWRDCPMARCEQGYLCEVCGRDVEEITDSDLYLRYILGEVPLYQLHQLRERHVQPLLLAVEAVGLREVDPDDESGFAAATSETSRYASSPPT